jgi:hypothetical protein
MSQLTTNIARSGRVWAPVLITGMLALTACGGGSSGGSGSSTTSSAMALAKKIPGTSGCQTQIPDVNVTQDVICQLSDGSALEIATFTDQADETQWIQNGGSGSPPDPSYAGCCIEGTLWAATVSSPDFVVTGASKVTPVLGGKVVDG